MIPSFRYTPEEISLLADKVISEFEKKISEILSIPTDKRNFENTVKAFEKALAEFNHQVNIPIFLAYVSPDPNIRSQALELEQKINKYSVDIFTREDIFKAVKSVAETKIEDETDKKLVDKIIFTFKQNGLYGDEKTRRKIKKLLKELVDLELEFSKNLRESHQQIEVDETDLKGLDENYIKRLSKTEDGRYIITTDYPDYLPFMDNAESDIARKELEVKFNNRCYPENVELMERAIRVRQRIAKLLGYKNFADYVLEDRMAKKSENVMNFLKELYEKVKKKGKKELRTLLRMKNQRNDSDEKFLYNWQWRYYANKLKKERYDIDYEKLREYFPLEKVISGMFEVFEIVFNIRFVAKELDKWHESVRTYEVREKNGETIAYFYFDLFPRDGKYKHAACFGLIKGMLLDDGRYRKPAAAIVANFTPPFDGNPSLLKLDEVVTLFHEFGHVTHNIFTRSKYAIFSGTSVARDFVEVPSQCLENWAYSVDVLKKISSHYKTGKPLPQDIIERIIKAKNATSGLHYLRQIFLATLDMVYHTKKGKVDTTKIYEKLMKKIFLIPMTKSTHPQANFGHLMGGYEAGYYSYLWSEVISCDFFEEFKRNGILNPSIGLKYREMVLAKGGSIDESRIVRDFLGRDVQFDAFLRHIGVVDEKISNT